MMQVAVKGVRQTYLVWTAASDHVRAPAPLDAASGVDKHICRQQGVYLYTYHVDHEHPRAYGPSSRMYAGVTESTMSNGSGVLRPGPPAARPRS